MGKFNTSRNLQPHKRYKKNLPNKEFSQQTTEMLWRSEIWGSGDIGKERAMGILPGNYCKGESVQLSSVAQSCLTLWPHGLQHARPPCPSPTPGVYPNPCPLSRWCHPTISSSVFPFSSCLQFFPASGSFQMSQLFASGGQSTGVSAIASVLSMNTQDWSPLDGLVGSPWSPRESQESSPTPQFKSINSLVLSFLHSPTLTSILDHWKNHSFD